jgi:integrase
MHNAADNAARATQEQLDAVNGRLKKKGSGSILYRNIGKNLDGSTKYSPFLYILFYRNGKQVFVNTKTNDVEDAYRQLLDARREVERGKLVLRVEADRISYQTLKQRYIAIDANRENAYQWVPLDKFFKNMKATQIDAATLQTYISHRHRQGVVDPTIRRELVILRAMFWRAVEDKELSVDQMPHFRLPKDSEGAAQYIDPQTFVAIRSRLPNGQHRCGPKGGHVSDTNLQPFFTFLYASSCRLGAAQAIVWKWINKDCTEINIPAGVTKNSEAYPISLNGPHLAPVREYLAEQRAARAKQFIKSDDEVVFDSTNYRPEWAKACAKAGHGTWENRRRGEGNFRIHDLRASAAVNLLDAGVPESTVMQIGGWKTRAMLDRYAKLTPRRAAAAMEAAGLYVQRLMEAGRAR